MANNTIDNVWHAFALQTKATQSARQYWVERGPRNGSRMKSLVSNELNVVRSCKHAGYEIYIPMALRMTRHNRTKQTVNPYTPMIPGFGFMRNVTDFAALENVKYLGRPLGINGEPTPIPTREIDNLILEEEKQHIAEQDRAAPMTLHRLERMYRKGQHIHIKDGQFEGQKLQIEQVLSGSKVRGMMNLLGGLVPVTVSIENILEHDAKKTYKAA